MSEQASPSPEVPAAAAQEKVALFLLDIGSPASLADVGPYLRRLYSDPHAMAVPFGAEAQKLLAAFVALARKPAARRALASVGGTPPESPQLEALAKGLAERLTDSARLVLPFVALRHGKPSIADALAAARQAGCRRLVGLNARPFAGHMASESARSELKLLAADQIEDLDPSMADHWDDDPAIRALYASLAKDAIEALPESERATAHLVFALPALPIEGKLDPTLDAARAFAEGVCQIAGLANSWHIAYLTETDPRADLLPAAEEALDRIGRGRAVAVIPLAHSCETLATRWEVDVALRAKAARRGIVHFARSRCPADRPELLPALEGVLRRHLEEMARLRASA